MTTVLLELLTHHCDTVELLALQGPRQSAKGLTFTRRTDQHRNTEQQKGSGLSADRGSAFAAD
jgi:hypothetical protein